MYPLALEAERLRSAAELSGVRSYLEPHFLLNSLNAVAGLVDEDPALARRLLSLLGDLLRDTLRARDAPQTLGQECAWLQRYAEVLELRHGDALRVRWELDPAAASLRVPRMLLQPLLENAILHGALRRPSGEVAVRTRVEGQGSRRRVRCTVEDNGPGLSAAAPARPGSFGLDSVRRRLALECPGASFTLDSSAAGTCATVSLPFSGSS